MAAAKSIDKPGDTIEEDVDPTEPVAEENEVVSGEVLDKPRSRAKGGRAKTKVEEQAEDAAASKAIDNEEEERQKQLQEAQEALDALDPYTMPKRWLIGKPPELGGTEKQYSIYTQDKLPWMARQQFFALVSRTFADALKASGGVFGGMQDVLGPEGGSLVDRGRALTSRDMTDATQFMSLAFELVGYSPDFLMKGYVILLDVPPAERGWAMERFSESWDPDKGKYGLKDEDHEQIIQTFIDQNYEEIRRFFVETLPGMWSRVALHEKSKDRTKARK